MAERQAKTLQIRVGEIGQHVAVDRLLGEQAPVLAKPYLFKPSANIQTLHAIASPIPVPNRTCRAGPSDVPPLRHPVA